MWSSLYFFFKQKTSYEMLISDWRSYVCSSVLVLGAPGQDLVADDEQAGGNGGSRLVRPHLGVLDHQVKIPAAAARYRRARSPSTPCRRTSASCAGCAGRTRPPAGAAQSRARGWSDRKNKRLTSSP